MLINMLSFLAKWQIAIALAILVSLTLYTIHPALFWAAVVIGWLTKD